MQKMLKTPTASRVQRPAISQGRPAELVQGVHDEEQPSAAGAADAREVSADPINHPSHYTAHPSGVECLQITEHMSFLLGNVVKYIWRCDHKNGVEDLKKARFYLDREIANRERAAPKDEP